MVKTVTNPTRLSPAADRRAGIEVNLDDLRGQLTTRIAIVVLMCAPIKLLFYDPPVSFPLDMFLYWLGLSGLCLITLRLNQARPVWARRLLAWGLIAALITMMGLFPIGWLPYLGSILIFTTGMLVRGSEVVTAVAVAVAAIWLNENGSRSYELTGILTVLALTQIITWLAARNLYTSLDWVWQMNIQAEALLETTRSQQAELRRTVKSLQIVNGIRERTERELLLAHKQLRQAQRLKEQFAANISHELRTPLSIILGFSEVMYLSPEVYGPVRWPPKLMRDIYQIFRNSRHLLGMIDDILDLSRFEMTGFTLQKEPTALGPLLQETAVIVADLFETNPDLRLQVALPPQLPAVEIDQTRIRQVLLNLLNNARRYTEAGTVTLTAEATAEEVIVQVRDTGPGIAPENLADLFTEFYQVDYSHSRQHGGAGLGLAICKRFVEAHDGRIWVESTLGRGATFSFSLPLPDRKPAPKSYQTRPLEAGEAGERPSVLVVDPDPMVTSLIQRHLEAFNVIAVTQAEEIAGQIELYRPLAAVCNVQPGHAPAATWAHKPHIPVIECSLPSQAWMADTLGAVACLTKPVNFDILATELTGLGEVREVLVIDDNPGVCQLMERGLHRIQEALTVRMAYDGRTGLNSMQQAPPDLVILDLMMPEPDGIAVRKAMQADPTLSQIPVILLTATNYIEDTLAQVGSQIKIVQAHPWPPGNTLRCLDAILKSLKPQPLLDLAQEV